MDKSDDHLAAVCKTSFKQKLAPVRARTTVLDGMPTDNYDLRRIAHELTLTAQGQAYYGNALYVAKGIPGLQPGHIAVLERWLSGAAQQKSNADGFALQEISNLIFSMGTERPPQDGENSAPRMR